MNNVAYVFVTPYNSGKLRAFANIMFSLRPGGDGAIVVNGFKVFEGDNGPWVAMPSQLKKNTKDEYVDLVRLQKDKETGKLTTDAEAWLSIVSDAVIAAYHKKINENTNINNTPPQAPRTQPQEASFDEDSIPF